MTDMMEHVAPPTSRPLVLLCPAPQDVRTIFTPEAFAALSSEFDVREVAANDPAVDELLPTCFAVVGQLDLPAERIARAVALRAVLNVEGNFYPNVAYEHCFARGIPVLGCGPAYADAVAEFALGLALDLARGISRGDRLFRAGQEEYVAAGNGGALLLRGSRIGLLGYGNLGRALVPLLAAFRPRLSVFDPWLPDRALRADGLEPSTLTGVLRDSDVVFVLASVTDESERLLDAQRLALLRDGACLVLVSRAAVVDFDALRDEVGRGRIRVAIDVWPDEPAPPDEPLRSADSVVLSAHRAGGIAAAYAAIGDMVLDDLRLIVRGLPPARMQVAARELVGRYRNRPVQQQPPIP